MLGGQDRTVLLNLNDENAPIMSTQLQTRSYPIFPFRICSCFCFHFTARLNLVDLSNGSDLAHIQYPTPEFCDSCRSICTAPFTYVRKLFAKFRLVAAIYAGEANSDSTQEVQFIQRNYDFCSNMNENKLIPQNQVINITTEETKCTGSQLRLMRETFSFSDFQTSLLEICTDSEIQTPAIFQKEAEDLFADVKTSENFKHGVGEAQAAIEVKETCAELKEALEDVKEAKDAFKEKGYELISTTDSIFDIDFPDDFTHEKKCLYFFL